MNSNELNKAVMKIVQREIEPMVTEYIQQHPEYFHDCTNYNGKICSFDITLSYQPDTLEEVQRVKPSIFIRIGGLDIGHELNCYAHHQKGLQSRFWIDHEIVTDQELPNV